jgi:6-pyruvoyltetrahydropterin/6-carboxytetrahydropterin synthase
MLLLTKIFHFEMAHAILDYQGVCKNIHGHSYELHVTVSGSGPGNEYIPAPGFVLDFKELKQIAGSAIVQQFDHKLVLSRNYLAKNQDICSQENLVVWDAEPTAENMLIYIQKTLREKLPPAIRLVELKLYETKDSYATWVNTEKGS